VITDGKPGVSIRITSEADAGAAARTINPTKRLFHRRFGMIDP
jgi:hypothetical protein